MEKDEGEIPIDRVKQKRKERSKERKERSVSCEISPMIRSVDRWLVRSVHITHQATTDLCYIARSRARSLQSYKPVHKSQWRTACRERKRDIRAGIAIVRAAASWELLTKIDQALSLPR